LLVPSPPPHLKPEMTVQVTIHAAKHAAALVVPPQLVFGLDSTQPYALRIRQGLVERANLEVGLRSSEAVEILSGLADDDQLVVPSNKLPSVGARVRPRPWR
jgi:HlyD family secretion protein